MDWWKNLIQKPNKSEPQEYDAVAVLKKRVRMQAVAAISAIALILVLVFSMTAAWYTNVAKTSDLTFKAETWGYDSDKITVGDVTIAVAPGSEGFIPLSVDNSDSTEKLEIGLTISQIEADEDWEEELRKRIFFFADTGKTFEFSADEDVLTALENASEEETPPIEEVDPFDEPEDSETEEPVVPQTDATDPYSEEENTTYQETVSRIYIGATEENGYHYSILPGHKLLLDANHYNDVPVKWMWVYDMLGYYFRGSVIPKNPEVVNASDALSVEEYLRPIEFSYADAVYNTAQYQTDENG